ncbi:MAG: murein biosynthesis integral membrane protein MurJ, partial [Armatimonadota bacterium]
GFVEGNQQLVQLTVVLTRIILPCQLFFFVGGLMMATLQSRQEFRATAAGPVIYNIGIIFGALVLSRWFNIAGVAIGTLIGAFLGNVVYAFYWMRKLGFEFHPSLNIRHPGVVRVAQLALPVIFGLGLPQIDVIINKWFASYVSDQAPAALNYANRLMQVPLGIFAQAAGTAILPMLAAYAAKNAIDDMRSGIAYGVRAIMVESIPATVFMVVMADPLVRMIYMGGEFTAASVPATVIPLIWYSVGIYAWAGQAIVARGFFALQDTITPVVIGTVSTIVFIPLNYFLMRTMGTGGIALSTTIAISLHFFGLTWFLRRRLNGIEGGKIVSTVGRIVVAAAVMGVVCVGVRFGMARIVDVESKMGSFITILVAMALGGATYLGLLRVLKVDELDYLWSGLRRRIFKRPGGGTGVPPSPAIVEPVAPGEPLE